MVLYNGLHMVHDTWFTSSYFSTKGSTMGQDSSFVLSGPHLTEPVLILIEIPSKLQGHNELMTLPVVSNHLCLSLLQLCALNHTFFFTWKKQVSIFLRSIALEQKGIPATNELNSLYNGRVSIPSPYICKLTVGVTVVQPLVYIVRTTSPKLIFRCLFCT